MNEKANYYLDITGELCPMTFVKTKLAIEKMHTGDTLEVRLKGDEPLRNVPRSVRELGHVIVSVAPEPGESAGGIHRLRIAKA
ncbi:sulfurtransferase TusA family protein [Telmatospirillum sp.]|uniref:sulfurtransferase TusA family protein n=1 Tax=Telmatospirillum sp. TaxID=2079197 RepID=UPI002843AB96|nr:sulfurtransferase TusA family protein [Telmatospirillum sp.]MDR3440415.1 sulfurtransferase TusA family protein [Telmatospirillum sp.]